MFKAICFGVPFSFVNLNTCSVGFVSFVVFCVATFNVLAKFKCKSVDNQKLFLVNADEELIPFSTLEDYFDNTLKVATQNTPKNTKPTEQVFRLAKENGAPKQIAVNIEDDGSYSIKVTY
jgi:hypothetical protein